jgi:hypothetical protein
MCDLISSVCGLAMPIPGKILTRYFGRPKRLGALLKWRPVFGAPVLQKSARSVRCDQHLTENRHEAHPLFSNRFCPDFSMSMGNNGLGRKN